MNRERTSVATVFALRRAAIAVSLPDDSLARDVNRLLLPFHAANDTNITEMWQVTTTPNGWQVAGPLAAPDAFQTREELLEALEYLIVLRLLHHADGTTHLHASGAVHEGRAVLALGDSGAGKTTLGFHWSLDGVPVLGDDIVFVEPDGMVHAFPRLFNVDRTRFAARGVMPDPALALGTDDAFAWFDPASHGGWADPARVGTVARIVFQPDTDTVVVPLPPAETLSLLLASVMDGGLAPETSLDRLARIAERARGVHVTFGDAQAAATALLEA